MKFQVFALLAGAAQAGFTMFEYGHNHAGEKSTSDIMRHKWELLMQGKLAQKHLQSQAAVEEVVAKKAQKLGEKFTLLDESENDKLYFVQNKGQEDSCSFKYLLEEMGKNSKIESKNLLSTYERSKDDWKEHQFLRVGLGNINFLPIIEDGDLQGYPTAAYFSHGQACTFEHLADRTLIHSTVQAPNRSNYTTFQTLHFETEIEFGARHDQGGRIIKTSVKQTNTTTKITASEPGDYDFMEVTFDSPDQEKVYGMGLQYTEMNFKGKRVYMITSEGGVGRGLQPITDMGNTERKNMGGTTMTTYAPSYSFVTSLRRGFIFNNHTEIGHIDFSESPRRFSTLMWQTTEMRMTVVSGATMKSVVSGITEQVGRMRALPKWTQEGAIVGLQGGQDKVTADYNFLKSVGVPMKAIWMQDWVGTFAFPEGVRLLWNWQLNNHHYPDWNGMIDSWAKDGVRPMTYMNPYFANLTGHDEIRDNYFEQGVNGDLFVNQSATNEVYQIQSVSIKFAMIDFTNNKSREWAKNIIKNNMLKEASSVGWMADFAEYTPMDTKYHDFDRPAQVYHNRYPYEWAKLNQEAIAEAGTQNETVYFMRAGSTHAPGSTSLYWMGDQLPTLDRFDGLHSALIGLLNGGMVGFSIGHSDIGGYTTSNDTAHLNVFIRDDEILKRWCEMNAFSDAIFRTHPSNNPAINSQVWDNENIAKFFKKFAETHKELGEYRMTLMQEMETTGLPITRSLMLELDDTDLNIDDQFMLGSEVMMAPIVVKGATSRQVYFPEGQWKHYFTGEITSSDHRDGLWKKVDCPLGTPCAYRRVKSEAIVNQLKFGK